MGHISGGGGLLEQLVFSIRAALVSDAVKVRMIEMLTASGGPTSSSEVSGSLLPREKS